MDKSWKVRFLAWKVRLKAWKVHLKAWTNHTPRSPQRMPDRQRCPEATKFAAFFKKAGLRYQHAKNLCMYIR